MTAGGHQPSPAMPVVHGLARPLGPRDDAARLRFDSLCSPTAFELGDVGGSARLREGDDNDRKVGARRPRARCRFPESSIAGEDDAKTGAVSRSRAAVCRLTSSSHIPPVG